MMSYLHTEGDALRKTMFELLDQFDFETTREVMKFMNWKWATETGGSVFPTVEDLTRTAHSLMDGCIFEYEKQCCRATGMSFSTGGLKATIERFGDERTPAKLSLSFVAVTARQY